MNKPTQDRIRGSLFGLALGDAFGAPYEGGLLERALWRFIGWTGGRRRFTDDTQMTIELAESLVEHGQIGQDDLAHRFARSYRWSRGYGPGASRVLARIRRGEPWRSARTAVYKGGSYGNGGAMRAPVIGLFYAGDVQKTCEAARLQAEITHAHPLGIEGAVLIAQATALAVKDISSGQILDELVSLAENPEYKTRLELANTWLTTDSEFSKKRIVSELGNGIAAHRSCVTAIYLALKHRAGDYKEMLADIIRLGGDVDTIAAMAGAVWGAARGAEALPAEWLLRLEQAERLEGLALQFNDAINKG